MSNHNLEQLELKIALLLRYGVLAASSFLLIGWALQIGSPESPFEKFQTYNAISFYESWTRAWSQRNWGLLSSYVGLVALICLPSLRVLLSAYLFFKQREFRLGVIALLVLAGLFLSFSLGFEYD